MSPIRGHLLLLGLTATLCAGSFVLDFLYVRRGDKGGEYLGISGTGSHACQHEFLRQRAPTGQQAMGLAAGY